MILRDATASDAPGLAALLNHYIRETTITFTTREKTDQALARDLAARQSAGLPWIMAEGPGGLIGYVTAAPFRQGDGYAQTLEHALFVAPGAQGAGVGQALMAALEARLTAHGAVSIVAGISAENDRALAFHRQLGFAKVGHVARAGVKFGRMIDLVLLQKHLSRPSDSG